VALEELVKTTLASTWPAAADPGMTLKLPLRLCAVQTGTLVEGTVDPLVGWEVLGKEGVEEAAVVGEEGVGNVVPWAFGDELLLQPARVRPTVDSETAIATRCKTIRRSYRLFGPAGLAQTEDGEMEGADFEAEPGLCFSREAGEHSLVRLIGRPAPLAHEMPVRLRGELVGSRPVAEVRVDHQADPLELVEVAVHGGDVHVRNPLLDLFR
jgi:hypothetical protein